MSDVTDRLGAALADRYALERELGAGGMATVYLAQDLKHDRKVALKVLRPELAAVIGADRFLAEIKTTANLQHPHILPLFDSGVADSFLFYVMPFVEGESLRDRLLREKQLPVDEAVRIAREVLSALDYAHRHQVIHRDIKPENILLHDGSALVADFGIALAVSTAGGGTRMTETGMSLGTPHYMSPEQAMGEREITAKSDVYALGCVLYELLVGEPPFTGPTAQAIVARVVTEEPRSLTLQRKTIPPHIAASVEVALAKLPADRFGSAAEFAAALGGEAVGRLSAAMTQRTAPVQSAPARASAWPAWVAASILGAAALWGWLRPKPLVVPPPLERFTLAFEGAGQLGDASGSPIALSPDGSRIVYLGSDTSGGRWLYTRTLDRVDPAQLPGTLGAIQPFFSPDGLSLGFQQDGKLRRVSLAGGAIVSVCDIPGGGGQGAAWGMGDVIVFSAGGTLYRVPATGGQPAALIAPDSARGSGSFRWPDFLADGKQVVFTVVQGNQPVLAVVSLEDPTVTPLGQAGMSPRWVDSGFLVFVQTDGTLFTAAFDPVGRKFTSPPEPIAEAVSYGPAFIGKLGIARGTGALAYFKGVVTASELALVDRQGRTEVLPVPPGSPSSPRFSPDGGRIAFANSPSAGGTDLWVYDRSSRNSTRVTFDSVSQYPEWEPSGRYLAYATRRGRRGAGDALYRIAVDGSGTPESLLVRPGQVAEVAFTPDRRRMVFRESVEGTGRDIWVASVDSPAAARPILRTPFNEREIALSKDGSWLAYVSDEAGSDEVYVRRLEEGSPRWRVSAGGGNEPRWGPGGRELLYRDGDSVYVVSVTPGEEWKGGPARALLGGRFVGGFRNIQWDISPDGTQFVFLRRPGQEGGRALNLVLHWFEQRGRR